MTISQVQHETATRTESIITSDQVGEIWDVWWNQFGIIDFCDFASKFGLEIYNDDGTDLASPAYENENKKEIYQEAPPEQETQEK